MEGVGGRRIEIRQKTKLAIEVAIKISMFKRETNYWQCEFKYNRRKFRNGTIKYTVSQHFVTMWRVSA